MSLTARQIRRQEKQATKVEVVPGMFKRVSRCSPAELVAASTLNFTKQRLVADVAALLGELAQYRDLGPVPEWFAPASQAAMLEKSSPAILEFADLTRWLEDLGSWHRGLASTGHA